MDVKPIIVGVDGSPDSERALQWAANYARRSGAPLHAVTTWELPTVYGPAAMVSWESSESMERQALAVLTDSVRSALGEDAEVAQRTERGHPSEVLVEMGQDAQLLVVGSRGRGGSSRPTPRASTLACRWIDPHRSSASSAIPQGRGTTSTPSRGASSWLMTSAATTWTKSSVPRQSSDSAPPGSTR